MYAAVVIGVRDLNDRPADHVALVPELDAFLRRGVVGALGEQQLLQRHHSFGLRVHATAFNWFRGGQKGIFIMNPQKIAAPLHAAECLVFGTKEQLRRIEAEIGPLENAVVRARSRKRVR